AGQFREARRAILRPRIQRVNEYFSLHHLGMVGAELFAAAQFFDRPFVHIVPDLTPPEQSLLSNLAGFSLQSVGRLVEARDALSLSLKITECLGNRREEAVRLGNLCILLLDMGQVDAALGLARKAVAT